MFQTLVFYTSRPLHVASRSGCLQVVQNLVTRGADLYAVDSEGKLLAKHVDMYTQVSQHVNVSM